MVIPLQSGFLTFDSGPRVAAIGHRVVLGPGCKVLLPDVAEDRDLRGGRRRLPQTSECDEGLAVLGEHPGRRRMQQRGGLGGGRLRRLHQEATGRMVQLDELLGQQSLEGIDRIAGILDHRGDVGDARRGPELREDLAGGTVEVEPRPHIPQVVGEPRRDPRLVPRSGIEWFCCPWGRCLRQICGGRRSGMGRRAGPAVIREVVVFVSVGHPCHSIDSRLCYRGNSKRVGNDGSACVPPR